MSAYFSAGVENVCTVLKAKGENRSSFPRSWQLEHGRIGATESVHKWFVRCVNDHLGGDLGHCQVADRLAVFVVVHWRNDVIAYLNFQALVTVGGTLEDYYLDSSTEAQYLRLDYDMSALGAMFREPLPHVHIRPDGEPRFPMMSTPNVIIDFFDFIYRNYFHSEWIEWAESLWRKEAVFRKLDVDAFDRVKEAFDRSQYDELKRWSKPLGYMKRAWRGKKDELWPYLLPADELALLSYEP
ncbi:hypothetical protein [Sorangium sp. So ce131]|uniref:hypothetical protein n=1 Tax=Sorangium sp. So ce131 TaxID=3133282 RepID=UPI003F639D7A